jgi:hypothetical protein
MPDQIPGFELIVETIESQFTGAGRDNQHQQFETKVHIKSTAVDNGNTPNTTLRGGLLLARKTSDGLDYVYDPTANDGRQTPIGILARTTSMLDRYGVPVDKIKSALKGGLIQDVSKLIGADLSALAVLLRTGFHLMQAEPHGSAFLYYPVRREYKTANYTITAADHGKLLIAAGTGALTFTLPNLATVGPGFQVLLYNEKALDMVVSGAANSIVYEGGGNRATTLSFNTAGQKMGASVLMRSDYDSAGVLAWYPLQIQRAVAAS